MRFDYDKMGRHCVAKVLDENSRRLSRTRAGVSDITTSVKKQSLLFEGEELRRRTAENERRVQAFIIASRNGAAPCDRKVVSELLWNIADLTNDGLLPTPEKLRNWSDRPASAATTVTRVPAAEVPEALERFTNEIWTRWHEIEQDPIPLASWAEWELNGGSLHPFYDGCGRISRAFSALLLMRGSTLLPLYEDRESYFAHGSQGTAVFASYVSRRISACLSWLQTQGVVPSY